MNDKTLQRDKKTGKIAGVCAGLAEYFSLERWLVRVIAVTLLLFFQTPVMLAYLVAWLVLDVKDHAPQSVADVTVSRVWSQGGDVDSIIEKADLRFNAAEKRVQNMEKYVTSTSRDLNDEFEALKKKS